MKTKAIAEKYNINQDEFETYLNNYNKVYNEFLFSMSVDDEYVDQYVKEFLSIKEAKQRQKLEEQLAEQKKQEAMAQMLISSGFSFDGYKIIKYSGYISGDDATQIPRSGVFGEDNGQNLTDALVKIRRQALAELKEAAYNLGCNAVVGVDFDYITLEPETANLAGGTRYEPYVICVTANGNAVVIEKDENQK